MRRIGAVEHHSRTVDSRARWRQQAIAWLDRSLSYYRPLADAGALVGDDVNAPRAIRARLTALRGGG
jgi:hypothetical protein